MNAFRIRPARETDAARVCEVLIRSVHEVCAADYGHDAEVLESWCGNKKPELVREWIADPDNYFLVLESPEREVAGAAMFKRPDSSIFLLYLLPEAIGHGNGAVLLDALEAEARRLGKEVVTLGSTITARGFYAKHGYEDDGVPIHWGKVKGYPMKKRLSHDALAKDL